MSPHLAGGCRTLPAMPREEPTPDDLIRELARLLTEGAQAVLQQRRAASRPTTEAEPQPATPASAPANSRSEPR